MSTRTLILASVSLAACAWLCAPPTFARETLTPLENCRAAIDPLQGCVVRALSLSSNKWRKTIRRKINGRTVSKSYLIRGRLNGGEDKPYALKFVQSRDDYFADTDHSGPIAQPQATSTDRFVVFTDHGELEILSESLRRERLPNVIVVDEQRWRVLARYYHGDYDCLDLSFLTPKNLSAIWDDGGRRCVSVRPTEHGLGSVEARSCKPPAKGQCSLSEKFVPAGITLDRLNTTVRDLGILGLWENNPEGTEFGGGGWDVRSYRVIGTHFFVIQARCADCGD